MFHFMIQFWAAGFYLLNKFFFAASERASTHTQQQKWRRLAWVSYLAGLPAWVTIFIFEHNWIAAAVESSGVPAMILGLAASFRTESQPQKPTFLDTLSKWMVGVGLLISIYDFGGLTTFNQLLELGIVAGFLMGTYLMAKSEPKGYVWLMAGNVSAAMLMMRQGYYLLMVQQALSLILVADALRVQHLKQRAVTD